MKASTVGSEIRRAPVVVVDILVLGSYTSQEVHKFLPTTVLGGSSQDL